MELGNLTPPSGRNELAKKCLRLIRDIADRSASSDNAEQLGYAVQELSQVFLERTGTEDRLFEPVPANRITDLDALLGELELVDSFSESMCATAGRPRTN
jgi:hypothetical protein